MDYLKELKIDDLNDKIIKDINSKKTSLQIRKYFLDTIKYCCNNEITGERLEVILSSFSRDGDLDDAIIMIAKEFSFPKKYINYITKNLNTISELKELYRRAFKFPNHPFPVIANNLQNMFSRKLRDEDIEYLLIELDLLDDSEVPQKDIITRYLKSQIQSYAEKPFWVSVQHDEDNSLIGDLDHGDSYTKYEDDLEKVRKQASQVIESISTDDPYDEEYPSEKLETDHVDEIVKSYLRTLRTDSTGVRDRVYGPENRIIDRDCGVTVNDETGIGGPCRMLVCMCGEDEESSTGDWFTGSCDACSLNIRDKSHCVRFPLRGGGYKGCYCSFKCIFDEPPHEIVRSDEIRMNNILQVLRDVGIMDRGV